MRVLGEMDRTNSMLRDLLNANFNNIYVNDSKVYDEVKTYLGSIAPDKVEIVKHYNNPKVPIFDHFGIEKQIKGLFGKTVNMKSGAYLIVEHTEALHVFDVNSGNRAKSDKTQEENALAVNLEAADEIAPSAPAVSVTPLKLTTLNVCETLSVSQLKTHIVELRRKKGDQNKSVKGKTTFKRTIIVGKLKRKTVQIPKRLSCLHFHRPALTILYS
jgi:hypothetical protein